MNINIDDFFPPEGQGAVDLYALENASAESDPLARLAPPLAVYVADYDAGLWRNLTTGEVHPELSGAILDATRAQQLDGPLLPGNPYIEEMPLYPYEPLCWNVDVDRQPAHVSDSLDPLQRGGLVAKGAGGCANCLMRTAGCKEMRRVLLWNSMFPEPVWAVIGAAAVEEFTAFLRASFGLAEGAIDTVQRLVKLGFAGEPNSGYAMTHTFRASNPLPADLVANLKEIRRRYA